MPTEEASITTAPVVCTTADAACEELDVRLSRSWLRIAIAAVFAGQGMVFSLAINMTPPTFGSAPYWVLHGGLIFSALVVMCFLGGPLFASTFGMLRARRLSIEGLFTLSLGGAFVGSLVSTFTGEGAVFYEIVSIVIAIYTAGRMLSERSQGRLRRESGKVRERFDMALLREGRDWRIVPIADLVPGAVVRVDPGAPFTVDGIVRSGSGYVRETALTGEPLPVVRHVGDVVRAGTWSEDGVFEVEVRAAGGARELDAILDTVEDLSGRPSEMQSQANRLVQYFLPMVAGVSVLTALYWGLFGTWIEAAFNSMAVLLVACPCALGLATPVAIWQGLFHLARMGLVSRDGALIDALAQTKQVYFDKTGTLSESSMRVSELLVLDEWQAQREALLATVHAVESKLTHPIARAVADFLEPGEAEVTELRLVPGQGVCAEVGGQTVQIGEPGLLPDVSVLTACEHLKESGGKRLYVFVNGRLAAVFVLCERLREGVPTVWEALNTLRVEAEVLTGDPSPDVDLPVAVRAGLSASEKEAILRAAQGQGRFPVLVGDGINDAAAMACASASIAMGSGAALTRSAASGQLTGDRIEALPEAIRLARSIRQRLHGNLIYAAAYNLVGMGLAASGHLHPVGAALIMLVSSFWVTARALKNDYQYKCS